MLVIESDGPLIKATNYWDTPQCAAGKLVLSINAGAFRLLLPSQFEAAITPDMAPAREVIVSRGPWPGKGLADAFEVLFDDGSRNPFALHVTPQAFAGPVPDTASAGQWWVFSVWTRPRRGVPHKALERPCWYRLVPILPCLKPREET